MEPDKFSAWDDFVFTVGGILLIGSPIIFIVFLAYLFL